MIPFFSWSYSGNDILHLKDITIDTIIDIFFKKKKNSQNQTSTHLHGFVIFCLIIKKKEKRVNSCVMGGNINLLLFFNFFKIIIGFVGSM
jgi:uncharacterized protein YdeI (YjbR/CyaY-like superfamily)